MSYDLAQIQADEIKVERYHSKLIGDLDVETDFEKAAAGG